MPGFQLWMRLLDCALISIIRVMMDKASGWVRQSKQYLSQRYMHVLKISDYHTTGLTGVTALKDTNWSGLVREKGAQKKRGKGGSHGVGKFAPYSFSSLRTVLYSTKMLMMKPLSG